MAVSIPTPLGILLPYTGREVPARLVVGTGRLPDGAPYHLWDRYVRFAQGEVRFLQRAEGPESDTIRISLRIAHPLFGDVFGYDGTFRARRVGASGG